MDWLRRTPRPTPPAVAALEEPLPQTVDRHTPGVAALLDRVSEDRSHAVLDLGPGADSSLRVYSRFASRVRFADLLGTNEAPGEWSAALDAVPAQPERPYDLVFAWNILDWIAPAERAQLMKRVAALTAPDARLYLVVEESANAVRHPLRFSLVDVDWMRYGPTGPPQPAMPQLLPAEVERLLPPFKVSRAFTSKVGLREYVAVRTGR